MAAPTSAEHEKDFSKGLLLTGSQYYLSSESLALEKRRLLARSLLRKGLLRQVGVTAFTSAANCILRCYDGDLNAFFRDSSRKVDSSSCCSLLQ